MGRKRQISCGLAQEKAGCGRRYGCVFRPCVSLIAIVGGGCRDGETGGSTGGE